MKKNIVMTIMSLALLYASANAQNSKAKVESIFLYNFAKNIEWPNIDSKNVSIGIIGASPELFSELKDMAEKKKSLGFNLKIIDMNSSSNSNVNMIFVTEEESGKVKRIYDKFNGKNVLIVSSKEDDLSNAEIVLFMDQTSSKMRYKMNESLMKKNGFKATASLYELSANAK